MKITLARATTAALLLSLVPASAKTIYPTRPCRVYVDTDYPDCGAMRDGGTLLSPQVICAGFEAVVLYYGPYN